MLPDVAEMPAGDDPLAMGADSPTEESTEPTAEADAEKLQKDIEKHFQSQVEQSERQTNSRKNYWRRNVELRQGNPLGAYGSVVQGYDDEYQSDINPDWYLTKTKIAALYSQVPTVQIKHDQEKFLAAVGPLAKSINYELGLKRCNVAAAMAESLADLVNASGFAAMEVGYSARFGEREVPAVDLKMMGPEVAQQMLAAKLVPMQKVQYTADYKFFMGRITPIDLLRPASFNGSDFDQAPWIGRRFREPRSSVKQQWPKLTDEQMEMLGTDETPTNEDDLKTQRDGSASSADMKSVKGKRVYYWRYRVDPSCLSFSEIWEIVWLDGITEPVSHGPWKGQKKTESGKYLGACKFPIRVGTTVYISDNPLPPSDSQVGRPQINDMRRSMNQMFQNRAFSMPLRWFNTDRTDPSMHDLMMKGQMQGMLPVQGDGAAIIGEVARASYPSEDFTFDSITENRLQKMWMLGPNQMGQIAQHETTKGEADLAQGGFNSVMGYERNQIATYFLSAVEVLTGLMALYSDFPNLSQEEKQAMEQAWDNKTILHDLAFSILPDSQVVLDVNQQIQRTNNLLNMTAKSGYVNVKPLITELVELHGKDPAQLVQDPKPMPTKPMTVSLALKGREDLQSPVIVAMLMQNNQFPSLEMIDKARKIQEQLGLNEPLVPPPPPQGGPPGAPPGGPIPPGQDQEPQWSLANKIASRNRDMTREVGA